MPKPPNKAFGSNFYNFPKFFKFKTKSNNKAFDSNFYNFSKFFKFKTKDDKIP